MSGIGIGGDPTLAQPLALPKAFEAFGNPAPLVCVVQALAQRYQCASPVRLPNTCETIAQYIVSRADGHQDHARARIQRGHPGGARPSLLPLNHNAARRATLNYTHYEVTGTSANFPDPLQRQASVPSSAFHRRVRTERSPCYFPSSC